MINDTRAAFEAWIRKDCGDLSTFGSGANIHYQNSAVNNAWTGWQAAYAASRRAALEEAIPLSAMRPIAVEAIRSITGCPDVLSNDVDSRSLVEELESVAIAAIRKLGDEGRADRA